MDEESFEIRWNKVKDKISFQYDLASFDPELPKIKKFLSDYDIQLKEIIFNRSEIFWRQALGSRQTAKFTFFYLGYNLTIQYQYYNMPQWLFVQCTSPQLIDMQSQITKDYFNFDYDNEIGRCSAPTSLTEVITKAQQNNKLFKPDFIKVLSMNSKEDLVKTLHFTPDSEIADLVIVLNNLGIMTDDSCEGHIVLGERVTSIYPRVGFPNYFLFSLLSNIKDWPEINNPAVCLKSFDQRNEINSNQSFVLIFNTGNLKESQKLEKNLAQYLKSEIKR